MASNRHLGRIVALQSLYEYEFRRSVDDSGLDIAEIIGRNISRYSDEIQDTDFVRSLVNGVKDTENDLDEALQPMAPEWPLAQIARVDHIVLRMGLYELLHLKDLVPPKVAINEAVELAKAFGSDNSSKFVNGVLGTAYRTLVEKDTDNASTEV